MANKTKNMNNKRSGSKKTSLVNNSSDQKENRPKKVTKTNLDDGIEKSKQLLKKKKTVRNSSTAKRSVINNNRVCSNGIPMPSLADLEKMYEDSDDDEESSSSKQDEVLAPLDTVSVAIDIDQLFSPSSRMQITAHATEFISRQEAKIHLTTDTEPPKKKTKLDDGFIDDLPAIEIPPCETLMDVTVSDPVLPSTNYSEKNIVIPSISLNNNQVNETGLITDEGNLSDNSIDSNKTIEYKLPTTTLHGGPQPFSPLPSTSKDNNTFIKNDELFNESLKQADMSISIDNANISINENITATTQNEDITHTTKNEDITDNIKNEVITDNNLSRQVLLKDEDLEIIETPIETIVIEDEVKIEWPTNKIKKGTDKDIQIIDSVDLDAKNDDDNDCVLVAVTQTEKVKHRPKYNEIINLDSDYNIIPTKRDRALKSLNLDDDIIDVDALIAENRAIIDQFTQSDFHNLDSTNQVIDVDISKLSTENKNQNVVSGIDLQYPKHTLATSNLMTSESIFDTPQQFTSLTTATPTTTSNQYDIFDLIPPFSVNSSIMLNQADDHNNIVSSIAPPVSGDITDLTNVTNNQYNAFSLSERVQTNQTNKNTSNVPPQTKRNNVPSQIHDQHVPNIINPYTENNANQSNKHNDFLQLLSRNMENISEQIRNDTRNESLISDLFVDSLLPITSVVSNSAPQYPITTTSSQRNNPVRTQNPQSSTDVILQGVCDFFSSYCARTNPPRSTLNHLEDIETQNYLRTMNISSSIPALNVMGSLSNNYNSHNLVRTSQLPEQRGGNHPLNMRTSKPKRKSTPKKIKDTTPPIPPPSSSGTGNLGDCPICLDSLSGNIIASTICGHVFCMSCLKQSIKANKRCPTCRKILKNNGYHQIFL